MFLVQNFMLYIDVISTNIEYFENKAQIVD